MKPKSLWKLLKTIFIKWLEDDPFQSAAALSYYTLFSLAPLLIISIAVAGFVFGREAAQNQIVSTIQELIGQESAQAVRAMIQNASNRPKTGMISSLFGGIILLFGAGGVVRQLQTSLNTIWGVKAQSDSGLRDFIRKRFISFAMVLGIGFLLLVSLAVSAFISGLTQFIGSLLEGVAVLVQLLDILISLVL
jgi:membrane protein